MHASTRMSTSWLCATPRVLRSKPISLSPPALPWRMIVNEQHRYTAETGLQVRPQRCAFQPHHDVGRDQLAVPWPSRKRNCCPVQRRHRGLQRAAHAYREVPTADLATPGGPLWDGYRHSVIQSFSPPVG